MHFQPLADIAENLEEPGSRHPNLALFNRLLNAAPSPTGFMGGALRRTSAQLQRLHHSPSIDQCPSDDDDNDNESCKIGKGGSLPSGLGQETQSTVCSFREEKSVRTPLLEIQFEAQQERRGGQPVISQGIGDWGDDEDGETKEEEEETETGRELNQSPVSLLPPPLQPSRETFTRPASTIPATSHQPSAFLFHPTAQSSLEHCSSQPIINQNRAVPTIPKPPFGGNKMSFLAVPSLDEPQRLRSVSMGSELTGT